MSDSLRQHEALWRDVLTRPHPSRFAWLPSAPRCRICRTPLAGPGGRIARLAGYRPSRLNPTLCNTCDEQMPSGGAELEIAVLFADVRGSTRLAERLGPRSFAALIDRFYRAASRELVSADAVIDKMIGDEVMALFLPVDGDIRTRPTQAAERLLRAAGYGSAEAPWLPLGIGVHAGPAFVGKVGGAAVNEFTAFGDTVNATARLQAAAAPGEALLSDTVYQAVAGRFPNLAQREVPIRGSDEVLAVRVLRLG
ncbi:MAG: adenylate/guanylate cyclase domain-containing protein [Chloroflexi bacterium]|nr:adenylate/guanylate cyclase domain-containing protein [Chloroflexota bacterium]